MLEGGCEVSTINVKAQADSVTFTPLWSGDYTFTAVGTDGYFTVAGKSSKNVFIKLATPAEYKGVTYNNKLQLSGATKLSDGTATIKVNVEKTAKITLVAAAKGASGEGTNLIYAKPGAAEGIAIGQLGATDEIGTYTVENVKPGTYYIGSEKGADIYDIKVEYDPEENKQAVVLWRRRDKNSNVRISTSESQRRR